MDGAAVLPHVVVPAGASAEAAAQRVEHAFAQVQATRMQDLPFLNPALRVEAVGFRVWDGRYLGILITPWFMNLVLLPQDPAQWRHVRYGDSVAYQLPAGVFEFISAREAQIPDYQSCSLFSPMFEFGDQDGARATAVAALDALFAEQTRAGAQGPGTSLAPLVDVGDGARAPARPPVSKRDFLRGRWHGAAGDANDGAKDGA
jgi:[NiFe] hydrogenase assembly HybE family chaperone